MARAEVRIHARGDEVDIDIDLSDDNQSANHLVALAMETMEWAYVKARNEQNSNF